MTVKCMGFGPKENKHKFFIYTVVSGVKDTIRDIHCSPEFLSNTTVSDEDEVFPPESLDIPNAGNSGSEVAMDCSDEPSASGETSTPTLLPTTRFLPVNTMSNSVQHLVSSEPQVSGHCQPKATTLVDGHAACTATNRPADEPSQGATPTTAPRAATTVLTPDSARTVTVKSTDIAAAAEDSAAVVDDTINIVDCGSLELMADAKHDDTNQRYPLACKVPKTSAEEAATQAENLHCQFIRKSDLYWKSAKRTAGQSAFASDEQEEVHA
ncbi:hypothetical protein HPB47_026772 [Ixodes persulcatus]|uniref:Uncharacterized protein n=1 Tax=Ixodes persulcatus TaxID=34615 RepID=A0AC60PZ93_IXOPE|nr:hypothetical protein HPB47_026772 [Ixodes persulcatus]